MQAIVQIRWDGLFFYFAFREDYSWNLVCIRNIKNDV